MNEVVFYMKDRPSRQQTFMEVAQIFSKRATCARASQGAVLVRDNRIVATGYNGPPAGAPHCNDEHCDINTPCQRAIHAEINVIFYAAKHGISTKGCEMYCTTVPCKSCAEGIIQAGITRVAYINTYRKDDGLELLKASGIIIEHLDFTDEK